MGGVTLSDNGGGTSNVAFRAVPRGEVTGSIPLPIGLIQFATDVPTFDPNDSTFNVYEIMNLAMSPPLTLRLGGPDEASGDVSIYVAQDSLRIDLQDVRRVVPKESMRTGGVSHLFAVGKSFGPAFVQFGPLVHVRNTFDLSPELRAALRDAVPFTDNTRYGLSDEARAQAALSFQAGVALRAAYAPGPREEETTDPRRSGATALYLGGAPKLLWGLAYGDARGVGGLTTGDTLFGNNTSVAFDAVTTEKRRDPIRYLKGVLANRLTVVAGVPRDERRARLDQLVESIAIPETLRCPGPLEQPSKPLSAVAVPIANVDLTAEELHNARAEHHQICADVISSLKRRSGPEAPGDA